MFDLVFDPPWYLVALPVLAGIILMWQANTRQNRRWMMGSLGLMLLGIAVWLVGSAVETDREATIARTRQVARSVDLRDWKKFETLLDPQVQFAKVYANRTEVLAGGSATAERVNVKNISLSNINTQQNPGEVVVDFQAMAGIDMTGQRPFRTNWRFYWRKVGDQWLLYRIEPLPGGDSAVDEIIKRMVK